MGFSTGVLTFPLPHVHGECGQLGPFRDRVLSGGVEEGQRGGYLREHSLSLAQKKTV